MSENEGMDCKKVRSVLWPADILRVSDAEVEAALEHARECDSCAVFLEEDQRIAQLIRDSVPRVNAPRELRERLYTALARERAGAPAERRIIRMPNRWHAAAAIVLIGLALAPVAHWVLIRSQPTSAATAFAEDYLRRVVEQEELASTDRQEIASFFARELGIPMAPPEVPEFRIERATICLMNGRRGGVVEYSDHGRHISYYVLPVGEEEAVKVFGLDIEEIGGGREAPAAWANEKGLGVATWRDGRHQHALVGNLSVEELRRMAPLFTSPTSSL